MSFELELKVAIAGAEKAAANLGTLRTKLDDMGASPGVKQLSGDLQKQIDLYGNMSRAAALAYDMERGGLAEVSAEQKKVLLGQAAQLDALATKSNKSFGSMRGMAQNLGWQMQDVAVQMQMGTNAAVIFTQQGSQFVGAVNPMAGAVIAVGGALIGALLPSLFDSGKAVEEVSNLTKALTKDFKDFNEEQKKVVTKGAAVSITSLTADMLQAAEDVGAAQAKLSEKSKQVLESYGGNLKLKAGIGTESETSALVTAQEKLLDVQQKIKSLQDLSGSVKVIKDLQDETALINLKGEMLWAAKAKQAGFNDEVTKAYIAEGLLRDAAEKTKKATEDSAAALKALQTQHESAVKAGVDFIDNLTKSNTQLQKQLDISHALSPAQQELINLDQALTTGKISLTAAQVAAAKNTIQGNAALLQQIDAERDAQKLHDDAIATLNNKAAAIDTEAKKQRESNEEMGLTKQALGELEIARINEQLRVAEQVVAMDNLLPACNAETEAHRATLKALQDLAAAKKDGTAKQAAVDANSEWKKTADSIGNSLTDALMRGFENGKDFGKNLADTLQNMFKTLILKPLIQPAMNMASNAIGGLVGSAGTKDASGNMSGASGMLGMLGPYGAMAGVAVAVGGAMISKFNDQQDAKFEKMTAQYRQNHQSMGTLLGDANAKSDSLNQSIQSLGANGKSLLDVNHGMYQALLDIKTGIAGTAAGFARTLDPVTGKYAGIKETSSTSQLSTGLAGGFGLNSVVSHLFGDTVGGFVDGLVGSVANALYNKKTKVIDSGIQILGGTLADTLESGMIGALTYADIKTTKKILGIKSSVKVNTKTDEMSDLYKKQFADVFIGAGDALEEASKVFGVEFDANKLIIDATKLSLKDLTGDDLSKEIESLFGSQLDQWATILLANPQASVVDKAVDNGKSLIETVMDKVFNRETAEATVTYQSDILEKYQKIGEGAFETLIRLASQTNIFNHYAAALHLNFKLLGLNAVEATQAIADASGGFDELNAQLNSYYDNFFTAAEKQNQGLASMAGALNTLGIKSMPQTREAFRALVEAQDLSTDAGQKQFAALMNLSGAFAELIPATESLVPATESVKNQMSTIYDSIASALKSMRGDSEAMANLQYDQAKATLVTALAVAKAGGSLANFAGLDDAISAITNLDKNNFASAMDYNNERGQAVGLLTQLQPYTVIDGSHANGLERVPFDGYIAQLHKGERVQTAAQVNDANSQASELRALKAEVRAGQIAIAKTNAQMVDILSGWEKRGMPETRIES